MAEPDDREEQVKLPPSVAYEAQVIRQGAKVARRAMVPSARESAAGVQAVDDSVFRDADVPDDEEDEEEKRFSPLRSAIEDFKKLNPFGIAGPGRRVPLIVLSLLGTVGQFDNAVFPLALLFITAEFDYDFDFILTVTALLRFMTIITAPLGGWLADRVSRVKMVRIGTLVDNLSTVVAGLAANPASLIGARVAGSLGPAAYGPAISPLMADYFPVHKRARVFGFMSMVGLVWGTLMGFFTVVFFTTGFVSWRMLLVGSGLIATAASLLTFFIKEPVRGEQDRLAMGADEETAKREQKPASWGEAWRTAASIGTLRKLWYATPLIYVGQQMGLFIFFAMQERYASLTIGSGGLLSNPTFLRLFPFLMIAFPQFIQMFMTPFAVAIADRLLLERPGRIMYLSGLLQLFSGLAIFAIIIVPNLLVALGINFLVSALFGLVVPARATLMSVVVPARIRALGFQTLAPWELLGAIALFFVAVLGGVLDPLVVMGLVLVPCHVIGSLILTSSGVNVERDMQNALAASMADEEAQAARRRGANKMVICRRVEVSYDGTPVLFEVDFDVEEGELVALLGTNGAGKSTLLRAISGIQEASAGAIFLDGEDITHKPPHLNARDGIVFLPGGRAVFPTLTVAENLAAAGWLYRDDEEYLARRTEEVLDFFPVLRERLDKQAGNMSGGEQQMLALGQAFLMRPRLLMIDELSLGLAPSVVGNLLEIVRAINKDGTTVILVEQSVNVALTIARRAVFMDKGEIRFDGSTEELLSRSDLLRAVFLGNSGTAYAGLGRTRRRADGPVDDVLAVEGVHVSYGGVKALSGVDLSVAEGEIVGIVGPNGAGKTTVFDVVSGFTVPEEGRVVIAGEDATRLPPDARARAGLARSFQDTRLFPSLSVKEAIAVALERRLHVRNAVLNGLWAPQARRSERRAFRRVDHLIDLLNLGPYADKFVNELSTGSRRMVDLACVIAHEPRILLLDEPSSGMAQSEIEALGPAVQRLARELGCGVLVIEHDIPLIREMADRLVAMELGTVIATGPPADVLGDQRVLQSYLSADESVVNRSGELFRRALERLRAEAP